MQLNEKNGLMTSRPVMTTSRPVGQEGHCFFSY